MSGLESGIEGNSATADIQVVGSVASHDRNVEAIPYWWGFKLTLSTLAVGTLHDRTEEIVSVLAQFLPHPLSVLSSLVVVSKQSTYKALSGPAGAVIASPWPMPLMLSQVREANAESNMMAWIAFAHGTWSPVARIADDYLKNTRPAISAYKDRLYLFHRNSEGQIYYMLYNPDLGWRSSRYPVPKCFSSDEVAACEYNGSLHIVRRGNLDDARLWHIQFDGVNWSTDTLMEHKLCASGPALAVFRGQLYCVSRGREQLLWYTSFNGQSWTPHQKVKGNDASTAATPTLAVYKDTLHCVSKGVDAKLWWTYFNGDSWTSHVALGGGHVFSSTPPSLCVFKDRLFCVARGPEGNLCWTAYDGHSWATYTSVSDSLVAGIGPVIFTYGDRNSQKEEELICYFQDN